VASPIEMLVAVVAVTGPSALVELVVCPGEPAVAVAIEVAVALPLDEVCVMITVDDVPFVEEPVLVTELPFVREFPPAPEVVDVFDPVDGDVAPMFARTRCLMMRSTLPRQSIVTRSPRAKCPDRIMLLVGTRHVIPPTLTREIPSLVIAPVVVRSDGC
jgi:hypothetical protein